jgi:hypothetical protein
MPANPPAFPPALAITPSGDVYPGHDGMSLRDWFAGQALTGLLASTDYDVNPHGFTGNAALMAFKIADAMLAERERSQSDAS